MAIHGWFSFLVVMPLVFFSTNNITSVSAAGVYLLQQAATTTVQITNHSGVVQLENELLTWVKWVGTLDHTVFDRAENRITPLATIHVDHRPGFGHFTTVQAAIDHVPVNNLNRVHIIVAPGVYK